MNIIYVLIPLSLVLVVFAIGAFFWAVRSGQFDDLHTPALKVLEDDNIQTKSTNESGK
jgi:cbb3-type cytochrome oxidase maturation protein